MSPSSPIEDVLARYTRQWMAIEGVVGTGLGQHEGQPCIQVFATRITRALADQIPSELEGYRVVLEETSPFRAL